MDELPLTGERTVPGHPEEQYWFARHEAVYRWILHRYRDALADGLIVDAGSGEGYGPDLLTAAGARLILGLEFDVAAATHARHRYPRTCIVQANLAAIPIRDDAVDAVVTLQVIEHLWDLRGFLLGCHRVLQPGGILITSTPNRPVFSPGLARGAKPTNPFHVEEFDAAQVQSLLLGAGFTEIEMYGLWHGTRLAEWEAHHGSLISAQIAAMERSQDFGESWPVALAQFTGSITTDDFVIHTLPGTHDLPLETCQDLIGVGRRGSQ
jgi:SAM-dependent methyltransferase